MVFLESGLIPATIGDPGVLQIQIGIRSRIRSDGSNLAHCSDGSIPSEGDDTPAYECPQPQHAQPQPCAQRQIGLLQGAF
jgi:hypothetical protein